MAIDDGLGSVYPGIEGHGAAVLIPSGPGMRLGETAIAIAQQEKHDRERHAAELAKISEGNPISKWTSTNYNELQPELLEWRSKYPEIQRQAATEKDPFKRAQILQNYRNEGLAKETRAKTDSLVFDEFSKANADFQHEPEKYDQNIEVLGKKIDVKTAQNILSDPYAAMKVMPELKKQVDEAGGVIPWRAAHWREYVPQQAYDVNADLTKHKLPQSMWEDTKLANIDGVNGIYEHKGAEPAKLKTEFKGLWDRSNYNGERFRNQAKQAVAETTMIKTDASDKKTLYSENPTTQAAIDDMLATEKNLSLKEQAERLPYYYGMQQFAGVHETSKNFKPITTLSERLQLKLAGAGGGGNQFTFTEVPQTEIGQIKAGSESGLDNVRLVKVYRPETSSTTAIPKEIVLESGEYKGKTIIPTVIAKGEDGKYYTQGKVTVKEPRDESDPTGVQKDVEKVIIAPVTETQIKAAFSGKKPIDMKAMFGETPQSAPAKKSKNRRKATDYGL